MVNYAKKFSLILTSDIRSEVILDDLREIKLKINVIFEFNNSRNLCFDMHNAKTIFGILTFDEKSEVIENDLQEVKMKN